MSNNINNNIRENIEISIPYAPETLKFLQYSLAEKKTIIALGIRCLNEGKNYFNSMNNEDWSKKVKELKDEIQTEKKNINILQLKHDEYSKQLITQVKNQEKIKYENEKEYIETELKSTKIELTEILKENRKIHQTLHDKFEEKLSLRESHWEEKNEKIINLYENKLSKESLNRNSLNKQRENSTIKGQIGEEFTYHELNKLFPKASVEDTRKITGRGDYIMKEDTFCMMIEAKNYTGNVPAVEIRKFYNDIDNNHDIQCAILISLKSGVCSKKDFCLEVRNNKPILFLHNIKDNVKNIQLAVTLFKLIVGMDDINLENKEVVGKLKNDITFIKRNWNKIRQKIKKFEKEMLDTVISQETIIKNWCSLLNLKY